MTFGVHFIIRNDRIDSKGLVPIYCKIILNGDLLKITTNQKILPKDWDSENELPKKSSNNFRTINNSIEAFTSRVYQAHSKLVASSIDLTLENLKTEFLGKKQIIKLPTLIDSFNEHNTYFESMIGLKYSYGSYKNYKTSLKYLKEFVPIFSKQKDIPLKDVNYAFCESFYSFLFEVNLK